MRRLELTALKVSDWSWEQLLADLDSTLEPLGLKPGGSDVSAELLDRGEQGRVVLLDDTAMARRAALALAIKLKQEVMVYEVVATSGGKHFRFRTEAFKATASGELKPSEGAELDLEPSGGWLGDLQEQAHQVLDAFARFDFGAKQFERRGFSKRKKGRPSSPRVAAILAQLQKAKHHEAVVGEDGRVELRIELAAGGKQRSFCSTAEYDELKRLIG